MFLDEAAVGIADGDRCRGIAIGDEVGAEFLQCRIGITCLVVGIRIQERSLFVEHGLAQDGPDGFALGEPVPALLAENLLGFGLVHGDEACAPAIRESLPVQLVENAGQGRGREAQDRQGPEIRITDHGFEAAGEGLVGKDGIEEDREVRRYDGVLFGRDG